MPKWGGAGADRLKYTKRKRFVHQKKCQTANKGGNFRLTTQ